ncbi:MAG: hypothetical protein D6800_12185, partial [Candidatus Zixiibacteriota bacterium]
QYALTWDNDKTNKGARKCWVFHRDLKELLTRKYGQPTLDETNEEIRGKVIPSGIEYKVSWQDSL